MQYSSNQSPHPLLRIHAEFLIFVVLGLLYLAYLAPYAFAQERPYNSSDLLSERLTTNIRALVKAKIITNLSSQVNAQVLELPFENGQFFKKGDVLVVLDCQHYRLALSRAKANLQHSQKNLENKLDLFRLKSVGNMDLSLAQAEESMARADVDMAQLPVKNCMISAPFDGRVGAHHVNLFQFVSPAQELIEIVNTEDFEIRLNVPSLWISWLKPETPFLLTLDEIDAVFQAKIVRLGSQVEAVSQTIAAVGTFIEKQEGIVSGMSGEAIFER